MPDTAPFKKDKQHGKARYLAKCIPMLQREGKSQQAAIGECENLWKENWNEKKKSNASLSEEEFWNDFSWASCEECAKMEREANGIFEIDIVNKIF
jgi:hypothetical protein